VVGGAARVLGLCLLVASAGGPVAAQDALPFLIINQEHILTGSRTGQEILAAEDGERDKLRSEARALDAAFEAEERRLTEQRPTLAPAEFRRLSDEFDARVVKVRREQDERSARLAQEFDQRRRQFYARVAPVLVQLMDRYGARAILDENTVLLADQSLNITAAVVAEIDAGEGATAPEGAPPATPRGSGTVGTGVLGNGRPQAVLPEGDRLGPAPRPAEGTDGGTEP
jgi:Skp family chaperone for outer membrane proteins